MPAAAHSVGTYLPTYAGIHLVGMSARIPVELQYGVVNTGASGVLGPEQPEQESDLTLSTRLLLETL